MATKFILSLGFKYDGYWKLGACDLYGPIKDENLQKKVDCLFKEYPENHFLVFDGLIIKPSKKAQSTKIKKEVPKIIRRYIPKKK